MTLIYTDKHLYPSCPTLEWDCPYIDYCGWCKMYEKEGVTPYDECDAFYDLEEEE